jgi:hypothetical protein
MVEIMDYNDQPRPRRERHPLDWTSIRRELVVRRPITSYPNVLSDDRSLENLHEGVRQWKDHLAFDFAEYSKRRLVNQKKILKKYRHKLGKLATCIRTAKETLEQSWYFAEEFSRGRRQCEGGHSIWRTSYLEPVLDLELSSDYLEFNGALDRALHGAQQCMSKLEMWFSDEFELRPPFSPSQTAGDTFLFQCEIARLALLDLFLYGDTLEISFQNVKKQLQQLLSVEDALDEEERQREEKQRQSDKHMERLERFIREVTIRLQMFVVLLLLFCKFSGISDNDQPMCITMPWNIRPALIVLWGVCWMFYTPRDYVDPTDTQHAELDGNVDFSRIGKSKQSIE